MSAPETDSTVYVDGVNGSDGNNGGSEAAAVKSLRRAAYLAASRTKIVVMDGEYNNNNYGGGVNNGAVMNLKSKTDILITNKHGHSPVIKFDGSGGIVMSNVGVLHQLLRT